MHWNGELKRNPFGGLDCDELLKTLDFVTVSYVHRAREAPQISREFAPTGFFNRIEFPKGRHWLWLCSSGVKWAPARIVLRHGGAVVQVMPGEGSHLRVHCPQALSNDTTELDPAQIDAILPQLGHPADIAGEMLERVKGNFRKSFDAYDGFIDAVMVLMFGVQAARHWSTCATSLMLLELIAGEGPCPGKPLTLANAFHPGRKSSTATIRGELNIMRHWLDLTELMDGYNQLSVKGRILKLLRTHLG